MELGPDVDNVLRIAVIMGISIAFILGLVAGLAGFGLFWMYYL